MGFEVSTARIPTTGLVQCQTPTYHPWRCSRAQPCGVRVSGDRCRPVGTKREAELEARLRQIVRAAELFLGQLQELRAIADDAERGRSLSTLLARQSLLVIKGGLDGAGGKPWPRKRAPRKST